MSTTMYSYRDNGDLITHQLPFDSNNKWGKKKLQEFVDKGFMFKDPRAKDVTITDLPVEIEALPEKVFFPGIFCSECGKECKSQAGLRSHMRKHD